MKPIVITITSQKGGSGKTSAAVSLSSTLAEMGYKILVVDGDPQANTSMTYGFEDPLPLTLAEVIQDIDLLEEYDARKYVHETKFKNIHILPSGEQSSFIEQSLFVKMAERERYIKKIIESLEDQGENYDFVIFDTNPSLGVLNLNIFFASDFIIIPVECSRYGIKGLKAIIKFYKDVKRSNKSLQIAGVVLTKVDKRKNITKMAIDQVTDVLGEVVFKSHIGIDTTIEKSQWEGLPIVQYDPKSRIADEYRDLAKEVLDIVLEEDDPRRNIS